MFGELSFEGVAGEFSGIGGDDESDECAAAVEEPFESGGQWGGFVEAGEVTKCVSYPDVEEDTGEDSDGGGEDVMGQGYFGGTEGVVEEGEREEGAEAGERDDLPAGFRDGLVQGGECWAFMELLVDPIPDEATAEEEGAGGAGGDGDPDDGESDFDAEDGTCAEGEEGGGYEEDDGGDIDYGEDCDAGGAEVLDPGEGFQDERFDIGGEGEDSGGREDEEGDPDAVGESV
ncbi:MAG: hypothetical protein RI897_4127 [Verrucomicrobiota bacterium]